MIVELAVDHLLRGLDDGIADLLVEQAHGHVGLGGGSFDDAERAHDRGRLALPADAEIAERALRLRAPISVGCDFDRAEAVGFGTGFCHGGSLARATSSGTSRDLPPRRVAGWLFQPAPLPASATWRGPSCP